VEEFIEFVQETEKGRGARPFLIAEAARKKKKETDALLQRIRAGEPVSSQISKTATPVIGPYEGGLPSSQMSTGVLMDTSTKVEVCNFSFVGETPPPSLAGTQKQPSLEMARSRSEAGTNWMPHSQQVPPRKR